MRSGASIRTRALAVILGVAFAGLAGRAGAKVPEPPRQLVISIYESEAAARQAMSAVKLAHDRGEFELEAYALVVKEANGKVKFKDKRAKGTIAGQAVAAVGGVLGARSGLGVASTTAGSVEYLTSNVVAMQPAMIDSLKGALDPGEAAVVSAVDAKHGPAAVKAQEPGATSVLKYDLPVTVTQPDDVRERSTPIPAPQVVPGSP
jgi:uncharacterized membrane protein